MIIRTVFDGNGNNKESGIRRAAAYCRVSTIMQDDSYEVQSRVYREMIESDPMLEFAGIYADKGRSGTRTRSRPGFMRMIGDAKEHRFDVLYVKSVSRFARGKYNLGNNRVLGYDSVDGRLEPNGDSWIVQMIFELYAAGETYHNIGRKLDDAGARTIRGNRFSPEAIRYIVSNETYIGDKRLQKNPPLNYLTHRPDPGIEVPGYYLTDDHPAIITRELWAQAQARSHFWSSVTNCSAHFSALE